MARMIWMVAGMVVSLNTMAQLDDYNMDYDKAAPGAAADAAEAQAVEKRESDRYPSDMVSAGAMIGAEVENRQGEELGEVEDVLVSRQDQSLQVVIKVGGYLGFGGHSVAVPYDKLEAGPEGALILDSDRQQLEALPAFDAEAQSENQAATR